MVKANLNLLNNDNYLSLRRFSVKEYYLMADTGILNPDEKVELITGVIVKQMSPQGSFHAAAIRRVDRLFTKFLGDGILVQKQLPVRLNEFSELEPDLALVKLDTFDYENRHPNADDIYLILEIADTTLKRDCEVKANIYASGGILDYWVLDLNKRKLYVYRNPTKDGYQSKQVLSEDEIISPLAFQDFTITISQMLGFNPK